MNHRERGIELRGVPVPNATRANAAIAATRMSNGQSDLLSIPRLSVKILALAIVQMAAKRDPRTQELRLGSSRCNAHCIRSIDKFDLVPVIALHKQAEARRKHPHRLGQALTRLMPGVQLFGIGHWVGYLEDLDLLALGGDDFESGLRTVPSFSQEHQRMIGCNCHDPGAEAALGAKIPPDVEKRSSTCPGEYPLRLHSLRTMPRILRLSEGM